MIVLQFYELIKRVCINLDRTDVSGSSTATLSASKAGIWVNDSLSDVATKYKFQFYYTEATLNTVAGSAYYALPCDYLDHFTIFCGNAKLSRYSMQNFDENLSTSTTGDIDSSTASGKPYYYVVRGSQFQIYPTPNSDDYELNLRYYAKPDALTSSGSYDRLTELYPETIVNGATYRGARWAEDTYNERRYKEDYIQSIKELIAAEKERELTDSHFRLKTWRDFVLTTFANQMRINYDGRTDRKRRGHANCG